MLDITPDLASIWHPTQVSHSPPALSRVYSPPAQSVQLNGNASNRNLWHGAQPNCLGSLPSSRRASTSCPLPTPQLLLLSLGLTIVAKFVCFALLALQLAWGMTEKSLSLQKRTTKCGKFVEKWIPEDLAIKLERFFIVMVRQYIIIVVYKKYKLY